MPRGPSSWRRYSPPDLNGLPDSVCSVDYDVSVIGLGRVGLPLAVCFADRGMRVLGVDNDPERVEALRTGRMPFDEPGMQKVLDRVHEAGTLEVSDRAP